MESTLMQNPQPVDVLIVGAGLAGISTALHLVKANPSWAQRIVVLDKAVHPREKLCGGGITQLGTQVLDNLGLSIDVPHFPVKELRFIYKDQTYAVHDDPVFTIVQRNEFDHALLKTAEKRGICMRQGEAVRQVVPHDDFVEVTTDQALFHAQTVVAADGSCSGIRRQLNLTNPNRMARLREVITPEPNALGQEHRDHIATFDFSRMEAGLQGYYWDFPCLIDGQPFINRGVFDSRIRSERPSVAIHQELTDALQARRCDPQNQPIKGFPIYLFDKNGTFSQPRLLLAGDAAGADPLLGEGISFALGYGDVAAKAIIDAFDRHDFCFTKYRARILKHPLLSHLAVRTQLAKWVYRLKSPRLLALGWKMAPILVRVLARINPKYIPIKKPRLRRIPAKRPKQMR